MIYKDYISLFTVSDEIKSKAFAKMKQRETQLKEGGENIEIIFPDTKKKNTFALHPKRWIAIATSLVVLAAAVPIVYYSIPGRIPVIDPPFVDEPVTPYTVSLNYMKNMMVDVDGVTAYSIRKDIDTTQNVATVRAKKAVSLLSASLIDDTLNGESTDAKPSYYLYSTNENYTNGNVEYDSKGIQKVTFVKNTEVSDDVYDDEGKLIDSNRKITQEELDGQINKIFTTKEYTYIQFVALVESSGSYPYKDAEGNIQYEQVNLRPEGMHYNEQGVADFDTKDYFSSNLTASFVIDNSTGYIYKIENFHIKSFHNGLLVGNDGYYYSVSTDTEHNLVFTDVLPNKDATVNNVILDNYGWTFVANDVVDSVDSERKVIYTTENKYVIDSDRNVYVESTNPHSGVSCLSEKMVDGQPVAFENMGIIRDLKPLRSNAVSLIIGLYKDLYVYNFNIDDYDGHWAALNRECIYGLYVRESHDLLTAASKYHWLDNNYNTIIAKYGDKLYYVSVELNDYRDGKTILYLDSDFTQLSELTLYEAEDYYMSVGNDRYKINEVYYHAGANQTQYYHIVRTTTGVELVELTSKSYTDNVFIFQPINK